jgi:hypothetical protein
MGKEVDFFLASGKPSDGDCATPRLELDPMKIRIVYCKDVPIYSLTQFRVRGIGTCPASFWAGATTEVQ